MHDPFNRRDMQDLASAVYDSRRRLEPFVKRTRQIVEDFTGPGYGKEIRRDKLPFNRGMLMINTLMHNLISGDIRTLHRTNDPELEIAALEREAAFNEWLIQENAVEQLRMAVLSALLCPIGGVVKVGVMPMRQDDRFDPGKTSLWYVSPDNWVQDMTANQYKDWAFCGHSYRIPLHRVLRDESISPDRRDELQSSPYRAVDEFGNPKLQTLSSGAASPREYMKYIDLWEIWLPESQKLCTFAGQPGGVTIFDTAPLKVIDWTGPINGPYPEPLQFHKVLNNPMGYTPAEMVHPLHQSANFVGNKMIRDSEGAKRLLLTPKTTNQADAQAVNEAHSGSALGVDQPQAYKEVTLGGTDQQTMVALQTILMQLNIQGGGFEQIAGVNNNSPTATQDEMKSNSAGASIAAMQKEVIRWMVRVFTDCDHWLFSKQNGDPMLNIKTQRPVGDSGMMLPFTMNSDMVQGDTDDFHIQIAPYSYEYRTPQQEMGAVMQSLQAIQQIAGLQKAGIPIDMGYAVRMIARYNGTPEVERMLNPGGQPQSPEDAAHSETPSQGVQNSTRTYIRKDRGAHGPAQQQSELMSAIQSLPSSSGSAA